MRITSACTWLSYSKSGHVSESCVSHGNFLLAVAVTRIQKHPHEKLNLVAL